MTDTSTLIPSLVFAFIFGTIVGSFLNVVSLRFNTGTGIGGRSKCMSCGKTLTWLELIPIFSFLFQNGSCKKCLSKISWQYPLVEFFAGAIFVLVFYIYPPTTALLSAKTILYIIITCLLLVICVYDIKHKIIPDSFVYAFAGLALVGLFVGGTSWLHAPGTSAILAGPVLALPFALVWLVSGGTWMGLGDAKLVLGIGWLLGISGGINALVLAFWIAAVISVVWILFTYKRFKPRTEIPFGPYLILGMYLVLLFGVKVIDFGMLKELFTSLM
jgi:prepilin signal peptidase PulO-like enzyme (type II secretory pathway)